MIRKALLAFIFFVAVAQAQSQNGGPGPVPSLPLSGGTMTGPLVLKWNGSNGLLNGAFSSGKASSPNVVFNPTSETYVNSFATEIRLTTGNTNFEVLPLISQVITNPTIYNYGTEFHTSGGYFHNYGGNTLALSGCTPAVNCPGSIFSTTGVVGMADNEGTGAQANAFTLLAHGPGNTVVGGTLDNWYGLYIETCNGGSSSAICTGVRTPDYLFSGFGTPTPQAIVHARAANHSGSVTGSISGTVLTITSLPTTPIVPHCSVTGSGVSANTVIYAASPADATNGKLRYTINNSQTVASTTLTLTCNEYPMVLQNYAGANTLGFITQSGGNDLTSYITNTYNGTSGYGFVMSFGTDTNAGATIFNISRKSGAPKMSVGCLDVLGAATLDVCGNIQTTKTIIQGTTQFNATGCSVSSLTGTSGTAGTFTSGTTGTCTVTITMNGATGMVAPTGWSCFPSNMTTANLIRQTSSTTTSCTISGITVAGDVVSFGAQPY